ncbi:MAG: exopolysaccharide biosynthesis protein [Alphaproteobacteria bacterium]|nr:exopolysaccharide biosynthesis protein [Alphaproteobacteria bacterium]
MEDSTKLMDALKAVESENVGSQISVEDVVESLNHRGFGTLLLVPAALTILPTGMIPGLPAICASLIVIIAAQMMVGRPYPWLPGPLKKLSMRRSAYKDAVRQAKPYIKTIDDMTHPRLRFLNSKTMQFAVALISIVLALLIAFLGFIPFVPAILAIPVFFFALGLSAKDGLFTMFGFILAFAAATLFPFIIKSLAG